MEYKMKEILAKAMQGGYAVPAICVSNMESVLACFLAARAARAPVIIQSAWSELEPQMITFGELAGIIRCFEARFPEVPFAIHLDHGMTEEECMRALEGGFPSIMYDGSAGTYEDNVTVTRRLRRAAGPDGTLEAEVGRVGGEEGGGGDCEIVKSDPDQLRDFLEKTGADAIAVSIGNIHGCHGVVKRVPELDFELLQRLHDVCGVPLVLHGASGIPEADVRRAVRMGICKVNYYTQLYNVYMDCVKENISLTMEECMGKATLVLAGEIEKLMEMCGCTGKAF